MGKHPDSMHILGEKSNHQDDFDHLRCVEQKLTDLGRKNFCSQPNSVRREKHDPI